MSVTTLPDGYTGKLEFDQGIITNSFDIKTMKIGKPIAATDGGVTFEATANMVDYGEDIDGCRPNTKQLAAITDYECKLSGTFKTVDADLVKQLIGAADVDSTTTTGASVITPRHNLVDADFSTLFFISEYGAGRAGLKIVELNNALSTGGYKVDTDEQKLGSFDFEFTGFYDAEKADTVPYHVTIIDDVSKIKTTTTTTSPAKTSTTS